MNQKKKRPRRVRTGALICGIIIPTLLVFAAGILAILLLLDVLPAPRNAEDLLDTYFSMVRMRTETVVVILVLGLALPIAIVLLAIFLFPRRRGQKPEDELEILLPKSMAIPDAKPNEADDAGKTRRGLGQLHEKPTGPRFNTLAEIDRTMKTDSHREHYTDDIDLLTFCERFRHYAAYERHLYYEPADIRTFIASLGVSPIIIMQGMSGTGKTSMATAFGAFINHPSTVVPIQPMWKERSDMIGYFNEFTERFNETPLLCALYEAQYSRDMYITILDEMNIARVEYYFADFLSLLELPDPKARRLDVVSDVRENDPACLRGGKLLIPANMWFIGTANNDDSTFAISDKVYDRAMIINLDRKAKPFAAPITRSVHISVDHWQEMVARALVAHPISKELKDQLRRFDEYFTEHFHVTFGNRIMKQIDMFVPLYVACGGSELDALDTLIDTKLLRKLELQNPIYVRNESEGLLACMDTVFGTDAMPVCRAHMARLQMGR